MERYSLFIKKQNALDQRMRLYYCWHKQEIMLNCVLDTVRMWFPETDREQYVDENIDIASFIARAKSQVHNSRLL